MANIINVEKSQYLNSNIEIYSSNKVGQYSKYLDKNPLFVTYFHINSIQSRTDVGTGGINADLGKNSPIRFNQINNLPVYNIPELKPDAEYNENGYDIEMDLNDLALLPNTIKPKIGDYLLIQLPNTIEFLFRVNSFSYNTIQSNDFYLFNADLKHTGHDLIKKLESQIVNRYETIFENIGTEDKCFVQEEDIANVSKIADLLLELRETYYNNFFDKETGTFVCKNNTDVPLSDYWLYDKYVEKFIMDSGIYFTNNDEKSIVVTCADLESAELKQLYIQTMHYAVLNNTVDYLASHQYYYQVDIQKPFSPFIIYQLNCKGVNLVLTDKDLVYTHSDGLDSGLLMDYFHHDLVHAVKGESYTSQEVITPTPSVPSEGSDDIDPDMMVVPLPNPEDSNTTETEYVTECYLDEIIYRYLTNRSINIDKTKLIPYMLKVDCYTYLTMPLIIYIIKKYYDGYFTRTE